MTVDSALLKSLEWRSIGPHRGGRVVAVTGDPSDPMVFYFGACAGGVWKTTDGGTYWENVSDGFFKTAAVGAIAVSDADPRVLYVGMGETCIRGNVSHGDGVYKSTDGGKTWAHLGLEDTRHIAKIRIHPKDPDLAYVAALGHAWGPNRERGLYRSKDGGKTWEQILFRSEKAGAIDLSIDPNNPRILYVAFWEAQRTPWSLSSGGPGSSLYKSTDGGDTWMELTSNPGLPKGLKGKIGVAVSPAKTDRVWALVEAEDGAVFRSDDGGATWQRLCEEGDLRRRAWYYTHIYADPQDPETVWVLDLACWKSVDGGRTFTQVPTPHGDDHDLWIDPKNPQRMIEGNDGGACVTFNGGASWSTIYNQPTAQFYHVLTDNQIPYRVYGSQQDNTAISVPSLSVRGAITEIEWVKPGGGESGYIAVKPDDPNIIIGGAIGSGAGPGRLIHYDHRTGQERNITVWPEIIGSGAGAKDLKYRFQWTFPILFSPHDPDMLYVTGNHLLRSTNQGTSWEVISPDLTRNDITRLEPSGGPITRDNSGAEVYCTIFAFVESPHEKGVFWAGSDDGLVHISRDGGKRWENVTPPQLPEWALISIIEVSPHDPATAYVAATRYKHDDTRPYLFKTNDYGKSWQTITNGIPETDFTRTIREDPARRGLLYAGTETGVYVSFDDGASWQPLQLNLPVAPIHDLVVKNHDLVAATHGRSFWILDDLTPLHQITDQVAQTSAHIFKPRPTYRIKVYVRPAGKLLGVKYFRRAGPSVVAYIQSEKPTNERVETYLDAGKNPPDGVIVAYYLKQKPEGEVTMTFLDAKGQVIKTFSSEAEGKPPAPTDGQAKAGEEKKELLVSKEAGANRFVWNMRYPDATKVPGDRGTEELLAGPVASPGSYQVQLKVGGQTSTESFEIRKDPRIAATQEDLVAQFDLLLKIRNKLSETNEAINTLRNVRDQVDEWVRRTEGHPNAPAVADAAKGLKDKLTTIEDELIQVKAASPLNFPARLNAKLATLAGFVDSADTAPAQQQDDVFNDLSGRIDQQLTRLRGVVDTDVSAFNRLIRDSDTPAIIPKATP
ncbi:MAG: glycosyl hydrolase [Candidatus Tectomicrobia bacterium]|nr:glycosyl hydrolase [Candidatus Tectomicrobia bacterium]